VCTPRVTAVDALECLRDETAMLLLAAAQAVDLRGGPARLGEGSRQVYDKVRRVAAVLEHDRPMEDDVAAVAGEIQSGALCRKA
jgi:histidine ammonia-lyase